jgi:hypothetical protein
VPLAPSKRVRASSAQGEPLSFSNFFRTRLQALHTPKASFKDLRRQHRGRAALQRRVPGLQLIRALAPVHSDPRSSLKFGPASVQLDRASRRRITTDHWPLPTALL